MWLLTALLMHIYIYIYINRCANAVDYWENFGFIKPWSCHIVNRAVSGSSRTVTFNAFRPQSLYYSFFLVLYWHVLLDTLETDGTLFRAHSQSTIYLFTWSPVSLQCGASCLLNVLFINQGLKWPPVFKSTINYWKSVSAATMKRICFSKYLILESNSSVSVHVPQLWNLFVISVLILLSILEYSPLANVAHNISPVPVLNCELNGPETYSEGVLSSHRSLSSHWKMRAKP